MTITEPVNIVLLISAILREKRLKNWRRKWKVDLIEESNPDWKDLYNDLCLEDGF